MSARSPGAGNRAARKLKPIGCRLTVKPAWAAAADRIIFLRDGKIAGEVEGGSARRAADYLASLQSPDERELATA